MKSLSTINDHFHRFYAHLSHDVRVGMIFVERERERERAN